MSRPVSRGNSNYTPIDSEDDDDDIVISTEQSSLLNESVRKYAAAGPSNLYNAHSPTVASGPMPKPPFKTLVKYYVPILQWLPTYSLSLFWHDLIAGTTLACILIPAALSYATALCKVPAVHGLYAIAFPAITYTFFGTSRQMSVGPEATLSMLVGSAIAQQQHWLGTDEPDMDGLVLAMAVTMTLFVGVFTFLLGVFRLGFLDSLMSRALLRGFVTAVAVVVMVQQMIPLLGLGEQSEENGITEASSTIARIVFLVTHLRYAQLATTIVSIVTVTFLLGVKMLKAFFTKRRWFQRVPEVLIAVIIATTLTGFLRLDDYGIEILGDVKSGGIPIPSIPRLPHVKHVKDLAFTSGLIAILGFVESIVVAKTYSASHNYSVSANRELIALGAANLVGGLFQGIPAFGAVSRSKINDKAGAQTQVAGFITGVFALLAIFFLLPWFHYLPKAVLSAIIFVAVLSLLSELPEDVEFMLKIAAWKDLALMFVTFVTTIAVSLEAGTLLAVGLSLLLTVKETSYPRITILGRVLGATDKFRPIKDAPEFIEHTNDVLIVRIEEPLFFANTGQLKDRLRRLEQFGDMSVHPSESPRINPISHVVFDVGNMPEIDASAVQILLEVVDAYQKRNVNVYFCKVKDNARELFLRSGLLEKELTKQSRRTVRLAHTQRDIPPRSLPRQTIKANNKPKRPVAQGDKDAAVTKRWTVDEILQPSAKQPSKGAPPRRDQQVRSTKDGAVPTYGNSAGVPRRQRKEAPDATDFHPDKRAGETSKKHLRHVQHFTKHNKHYGDASAVPGAKHVSHSGPNVKRTAKNRFQRKELDEHPDELPILPTFSQAQKLSMEVVEKVQKDVFIPDIVSVANLARILGVRLGKMREAGMEETKSDHLLHSDEASLLALEFDCNPIVDSLAAKDLFPRPAPEDPSIYPSRPPVVTIMGHVDHGKTTLLDSLRKTSVAAGEAGGITQHIGAFSVDLPSKKKITFLDTPGHAAFSAMRARGANATDIVVLVVAADDGVMPQTVEAIQHAQAAGVPIIVAINKCDKQDANAQKAKEGLLRCNIQLEEFGGDVPAVEVSGLTGKGLGELEETVVTMAEISDLRADNAGPAEGLVIESQVEKGRGSVATVLVQQGTLKFGDIVVAGTTYCKVRSMTDDKGRTVKQAAPGTPVKVIGWKELPNAGDEMLQATDESLAKTVVANRITKSQREQQFKDLQVINEKRRQQKEAIEAERNAEKAYKKEVWMYHQGMLTEYPKMLDVSKQSTSEESERSHVKELRAVVKGDVSGSVEAIVDCLNGLCTPEVCVKVVSSGVGDVTEGDIQIAAASDGHIIGFNVKADKKTQQEAAQQKVPLKTYSIIYNLLDDVKASLGALMPPIVTTQVNGEATILQTFQIGVKGRETKPVAGCRITNGVVPHNGRVRVLRGPEREQIWEGGLETLKQVKKDILEAKKGQDCGMSFDGFLDFRDGDIVQSISVKEIPRTL